jgi:hypothetical protein
MGDLALRSAEDLFGQEVKRHETPARLGSVQYVPPKQRGPRAA